MSLLDGVYIGLRVASHLAFLVVAEDGDDALDKIREHDGRDRTVRVMSARGEERGGEVIGITMFRSSSTAVNCGESKDIDESISVTPAPETKGVARPAE